MPLYYYKAVTKNGVIVRNKVEDVNRLMLMRKLKKNELSPLIVMQTARRKSIINKTKPKKNVGGGSGISDIRSSATTRNLVRKKTEAEKKTLYESYRDFVAKTRGVKDRDILVFTQNFYILKKANFNNIHALSTIMDNTENPILREILSDILAGVEAGESIYSTMEYYEGVFPFIYINMIKTGELSGSLTETLQQAINYLEEEIALKKKLKTIFLPNIVQFVAIILMLIIGTLVAIPEVQKIFESVGTKDELPAITLWFAGVLNSYIDMWYIHVGILAAIIGIIVWYIRTPGGSYNFDLMKYKFPIFGELVFSLDFSRFMNAVLLNINSGIRIQEALETSKNSAHNLVLLSIIETSINNILIGRSWVEPFEQSGLCPSMATEMMVIGMQTDLSVMLEKLLEYMKQDTNEKMQKVMKALPQITYAIVGVVLIFFMLVVMVPMMQVYFGTFLFSAVGM